MYVHGQDRVVCIYTCSEATVIRPYTSRSIMQELARIYGGTWPGQIQGGGQVKYTGPFPIKWSCMGKLNIWD